MKKIVYVTGCLGFIGSHVTKKCLDQGWYVRGIDKCTYASNEYLLHDFEKYDNFVFEKKDINELEFLYECDYVINTAAETHVGNSILQNDIFLKSNVDGVHKLLELIKNCRQETSIKPTLFHFSTDEVYGDISEGEHIESDILRPSNPYSATKAAADMLILAWSRTYGIPYVILRPTNNYGQHQYIEKLIPKVCKYLSLGRKIPLHNEGSPIRNWLHADDTAEAVIVIINSNICNEIFNVCGGFEQNNFSTVRKIIDIYFEKPIKNHKSYLDLSYSRPGQDFRYALNDSKLRLLGWKPQKVFDEELKKIVDFYKKKFIW